MKNKTWWKKNAKSLLEAIAIIIVLTGLGNVIIYVSDNGVKSIVERVWEGEQNGN